MKLKERSSDSDVRNGEVRNASQVVNEIRHEPLLVELKTKARAKIKLGDMGDIEYLVSEFFDNLLEKYGHISIKQRVSQEEVAEKYRISAHIAFEIVQILSVLLEEADSILDDEGRSILVDEIKSFNDLKREYERHADRIEKNLLSVLTHILRLLSRN